MAYLITFDLHEPKYKSELAEALAEATMITESSYLLVTESRTPDEILTDSRSVTNDAIAVYIFPVGRVRTRKS